MRLIKNKKGQIILYVMFYGFISFFIFNAIILWLYTVLNSVEKTINQQIALQIAESGVEYARWRLNHFPEDFNFSTTTVFYDRLGNALGQVNLTVTPPPIGSTIVEITSNGKLINAPNIEKIIKANLAKPSVAKYSVLIDDNIRFGVGTVVYGEIHSNKGIRFDGTAYNLIKSSLITYSDPDHQGCQEWAVHTHVNPQDPCPPSNNPDPSLIPFRPDVFKAGRAVGVPTLDFVGISSNLADLKQKALQNGFYLEFSGDNNYGYELVLKESNFDVYKVTRVVDVPRNCELYDTYEGPAFNNDRYRHSTWSIRNKQFVGTFNYPSNGVIFVEDNVWVSGKINNKKIIIASARFPENPDRMTNIIINDDLLYTNYDGRDVIGLIAQKNINIGLKSKDVLRIDSALIAQNGRVGRYYYSSQCGSEYKREKITVYGSLTTRLRYGFSWVDNLGNWVSGYRLRDLVYNGSLLYFPPPFFPSASEFYETIKWLELK